MSFSEFKTEYTSIFNRMMGYKPSECGASVYAEKLSVLSDAHPEFEDRLEAELEAESFAS